MLNLHLLAALTANDCPTETIQSVNDCLVKTEPNDKFVILKGKTRHGKCRVDQWGS